MVVTVDLCDRLLDPWLEGVGDGDHPHRGNSLDSCPDWKDGDGDGGGCLQ